MSDDFLGKIWADQHGTVTNDLHKLFSGIATAMQRLHAIQYDAPWRHDLAKGPRAAPCVNCPEG